MRNYIKLNNKRSSEVDNLVEQNMKTLFSENIDYDS